MEDIKRRKQSKKSGNEVLSLRLFVPGRNDTNNINRESNSSNNNDFVAIAKLSRLRLICVALLLFDY